GRQHFDRLRHLTQHPFTRRSQQLSLESIAVGAVEEPRHLREPGRRVLAEEGDQPVATTLAAEAAQRIQHGPIGLGRPGQLDTLGSAPTRAKKASPPPVFPMPGSPVTKPPWRVPRHAASTARWSQSSEDSRPTRWAGLRYREPVEPNPTDGSAPPTLSGLGSESVTPAMNR